MGGVFGWALLLSSPDGRQLICKQEAQEGSACCGGGTGARAAGEGTRTGKVLATGVGPAGRGQGRRGEQSRAAEACWWAVARAAAHA